MLDTTKYINAYLEAQDKNLRPATITCKLKIIRHFLDYCQEHNIENVSQVQKMDVYEFVKSRKWSSQTRSSAEFILRNFFNVMKEKKLSCFDGYELYPIIFTNKRDKILSYYSPEEIKKIIDCMDLSFKCGVRDKCMITIAAETGLRASDIVHLKFNEIKWDKSLIQKVQIKTQIPVEVPISDNVKYLLIDYMKNHRPQNNSEFIFINFVTNEPFKNATSLTSIVRKAFIKAGVDISNKKAGAHSLRHSLATNMLKNNTALPIITGVLGHTTVTTTEKYISVDIEGLRNVSLEVPEYD